MNSERDSHPPNNFVCLTRGNNEFDLSSDWAMFDSGFQRNSGAQSLQIPQIQYLMDRESLPIKEDYQEKRSLMSVEENQKISIQSMNKGFSLFNRNSNFQEYPKSSLSYSQKHSLEMGYGYGQMSIGTNNNHPSLNNHNNSINNKSKQSIESERHSGSNRQSQKQEELEIVLEWQDAPNEQAIEDLIQQLTLEKQPEIKPDRLSILPQAKNGCICRKTHCLKFYCQCFQSGKLCTEYCECVECCNNEDNLNLVEQTREQIIQKNPEQNQSIQCTCKKSKCLKKYCECFNQGQKCGPQCRCEGCLNIETSKDELLHDAPSLIQLEQQNKRVQLSRIEF